LSKLGQSYDKNWWQQMCFELISEKKVFIVFLF